MAVINERTIVNFQDRMQYSNGIHAGGHFTMGGDPGGVSLQSHFMSPRFQREAWQLCVWDNKS